MNIPEQGLLAATQDGELFHQLGTTCCLCSEGRGADPRSQGLSPKPGAVPKARGCPGSLCSSAVLGQNLAGDLLGFDPGRFSLCGSFVLSPLKRNKAWNPNQSVLVWVFLLSSTVIWAEVPFVLGKVCAPGPHRRAAVGI